MAPVSPQQKLEQGVAKVRELRSQAHDDVNEAWSALRMGIIAARKSEECLDSVVVEERARILEFVLERGVRKKSASGQVKECLRILLARPVWLASAQAEEGLRAGTLEALDSSQDAELCAQLAPPEPREDVEHVEAAETPCVEGEQAPEAEEATAEAPQAAKPRPLDIREKMARGRAVLQGFGWEFPRDPTGTRGDEATTGFMFLFDAVTALGTSSGRASVGGEPSAVLAVWEEDWANLLQFLLGMYTSGVRRTYSRRIRFVIVQLRTLSPAFRELAPWVSLPWGNEEIPMEEAEAEASALEEFRRQQKEVAEDERLARALQEEEEAEALAQEEKAEVLAQEDVRLELVQEDPALASRLQEKGRTTRPQQRAGWVPRFWRRNAGGA